MTGCEDGILGIRLDEDYLDSGSASACGSRIDGVGRRSVGRASKHRLRMMIDGSGSAAKPMYMWLRPFTP
jgi:hypothetical protein